MVLCIVVCLVVRLFGNASSHGPGTVSACVHNFGSFERLDGYGICQSAEKKNDEIMESILDIDFCGIIESLVSENVR